jgi:hypothetical protein
VWTRHLLVLRWDQLVAYGNRVVAYRKKGAIDRAIGDCDHAIKHDWPTPLHMLFRMKALMRAISP